MGHTRIHQWKYRWKTYWEKERQPLVVREIKLWEPEHNSELGNVMNRLLGNYVEWEYHLERPKDRSFNPPEYFWGHQAFCSCDRNKRWYKRYYNRNQRRRWRQALGIRDFDKIESLPIKSRDYSWDLW